MGTRNIDKCIFTGSEPENLPTPYDAFEYRITYGGKRHLIRIPFDAIDWEKDDFFRSNKYVCNSLLFNDKWFADEKEIITLDKLKDFIAISEFPRSAPEKAELLFWHLFQQQTEDGKQVRPGQVDWKLRLWKQLFFRSFDELIFYAKHLATIGLIDLKMSPYGDGDGVENYRVTFAGLEHAIKLQTEGNKSKRCFIAMSFNPSQLDTRQAIKKAVIQTGYEPVLIDETNIESDRTINDEIIANLKKSKFCIADFSLHSKGVYFESGFALGQGKKVIYTCNAEEFANAHFDIKPLQHIIYNSTEELTQALINKIEAFID